MAGPRPRVTLFVPGLTRSPLPEDPAALLAGLELPALERLLGRGGWRPAAPTETEAALCALFGVAPDAHGELPVAAVGARLDLGREDGSYLRADPVHLRADLDRLVLFDPTTFPLRAEEAEALVGELAELFEPEGLELVIGETRRWYLRAAEPVRVRTHPLSAVAGRDLRRALPEGPERRRWHRLLNETQMLLYASPVNAARAERGEPAVSSLWVWGSGELTGPERAAAWAGVWTDDPLAQALAAFAGRAARAVPAGAGAWLAAEPGAGAHLLIAPGLAGPSIYGEVDAWRQALAELETRWVAPLLTALTRGAVRGIELCDERGSAYLTRAGMARLWRRPRPLATYLA